MLKKMTRSVLIGMLAVATLPSIAGASGNAKSFDIYTDPILLVNSSNYGGLTMIGGGIDFKLGSKFSFGPMFYQAKLGAQSASMFGARANVWFSDEAIGQGFLLTVPAMYIPIDTLKMLTVGALAAYHVQLGPIFLRPALGLAMVNLSGSSLSGTSGGSSISAIGLSYEVTAGFAF